MKTCRENQYLVKIGQKFRALQMNTSVRCIVTRDITPHKTVLFEWHGISLLGQPRRYKHDVNAPQFMLHVHYLACFHYTTLHIRGESAELV